MTQPGLSSTERTRLGRMKKRGVYERAVLDDGHGAMKPGLASDGVHPTSAGYKVMEPVTLKAIDRALGKHRR